MKSLSFIQHPTFRPLLSIAIIGLFIGFIFSQLFPLSEKKEEKGEKKEKARIYQVGASIGQENLATTRIFSPLPLADALSQEFGDDVKAATRLLREKQMVGRYEGKMFTEKAVLRADSYFFDVFDCDIMKGNALQALTSPQAVVMTESCAKRYFGKNLNDCIGKKLTLDHKPYQLTAVIADPRTHAHLTFEMLIPLTSMENNQNWSWNIVDTYMRLDAHACPKHLLARLPQIVEKYARPQLGTSFDKWRSQGGQARCFLEAV